jgi:hypothetical protein
MCLEPGSNNVAALVSSFDLDHFMVDNEEEYVEMIVRRKSLVSM